MQGSVPQVVHHVCSVPLGCSVLTAWWAHRFTGGPRPAFVHCVAWPHLESIACTPKCQTLLHFDVPCGRSKRHCARNLLARQDGVGHWVPLVARIGHTHDFCSISGCPIGRVRAARVRRRNQYGATDTSPGKAQRYLSGGAIESRAVRPRFGGLAIVLNIAAVAPVPRNYP